MLELDDVSVTFNADSPGAVRALNDVTLRGSAGEFVCVVGANGSGKSTLVGVLAGAVRPDRGRVRIDGVDVTHLPVHRRAGHVARVLDDPRAGSAAEPSVEENLALAMSRGVRRGLRRAVSELRRCEMRDALSQLGLGLDDRLSQPVGLLSAGQRQSLTMVMATLRRPSILLLDEHLAALDPSTAQRVLALTVELARSSDATTVMVTHDMDAALRTGDRLLVVRSGRIAADLTRSDRRALDVADLVSILHRGRRPSGSSEGRPTG